MQNVVAEVSNNSHHLYYIYVYFNELFNYINRILVLFLLVILFLFYFKNYIFK